MTIDDSRGFGGICGASKEKSVPFALVGGQAVVLWVATRDPAAVRTTKDVDLLLRRSDLARPRSGECRPNGVLKSWALAYFSTARIPIPAMPCIWSGPERKFVRNTSFHRHRSTNEKSYPRIARCIVAGTGADETPRLPRSRPRPSDRYDRGRADRPRDLAILTPELARLESTAERGGAVEIGRKQGSD